MGCGVPGTNHLKAHGKPLCGDGYGYMWEEDTFRGMVKDGRACIACIRTLERNALARALGRLHEPEEGANIKTTLTTTERRGFGIAVGAFMGTGQVVAHWNCGRLYLPTVRAR